MTTCPFLGVLSVPHLFGCILLACQTSQIRGLQVLWNILLTTGPPKSEPCHLWAQLQTGDSEDLEWLGRSDCRSECCRCNLATLEVTLHWTVEVLLSTGMSETPTNLPLTTCVLRSFGRKFENWNFASFLVALILTQCVWLASSSSTSSRCIKNSLQLKIQVTIVSALAKNENLFDSQISMGQNHMYISLRSNLINRNFVPEEIPSTKKTTAPDRPILSFISPCFCFSPFSRLARFQCDRPVKPSVLRHTKTSEYLKANSHRFYK